MKRALVFFSIILGGCAGYQSPDHSQWPMYLKGASFMEMTETARIAKKPIFQGDGGRTVAESVKQNATTEYGDKTQNENAMYVGYMSKLENELYDALRRPGLSVQRAGTDVVVLMIRDALMELNAPEISADGDKNLQIVSAILKKYDATFIEIAGYTDSMRDKSAANSLSFDMASRVAVYLARAGVKPTRMFIVGRGSARPIAAQDELGRLTNRRVELRILPVR